MSAPRTELRLAPRQPLVDIAECTILVRVPGRPADTRVFTADEADEAHLYSDDVDGILQSLPLTNSSDLEPGGPAQPAERKTHQGDDFE